MGRGRPRNYDDDLVIGLFTIMIKNDIKSIKKLHAFLTENDDISKEHNVHPLPCRRTIGRRMKEVLPRFQ